MGSLWSGFGGSGLAGLASVELQRPPMGSLSWGFGGSGLAGLASLELQRPLRVSVLGFGLWTWLRWNSRDPIGGLCGLALAGSWSGFGWL